MCIRDRYNTEKYLARCIESILCQTYTNLEIILVDDGSTDKSGDICDFYARKDNRVKVVHKMCIRDRLGTSHERNDLCADCFNWNKTV